MSTNASSGLAVKATEWTGVVRGLVEIRALARRNWTIHVCGDPAAPDVVVAVERYGLWADVIILRSADHAAAYRTLVRGSDDPLATEWVVWHYLGPAEHTIPAGLAIPDEVVGERPYPIPPECRVPEVHRMPVVLHPGRSYGMRVPVPTVVGTSSPLARGA